MGKHELLRIKEILTERGMSVQGLKDLLGDEISYTYLSEVVRGDKFPRPERMVVIADALEVDVKELFKSTKQKDQGRDLYVKNDDGTLKRVGYLD